MLCYCMWLETSQTNASPYIKTHEEYFELFRTIYSRCNAIFASIAMKKLEIDTYKNGKRHERSSEEVNHSSRLSREQMTRTKLI